MTDDLDEATDVIVCRHEERVRSTQPQAADASPTPRNPTPIRPFSGRQSRYPSRGSSAAPALLALNNADFPIALRGNLEAVGSGRNDGRHAASRLVNVDDSAEIPGARDRKGERFSRTLPMDLPLLSNVEGVRSVITASAELDDR